MVEELDDLSARFADRLEGTYDCPDRIVLNAFYPLGYNPGGFREWWRRLYGGDESLDDAHLMRMAGRFSRRLRAWATANGVPVVLCKQGQRKHLVAEQYIPQDPEHRGVFLILVGRASAPLWHVRRSQEGRIVNIERRKDQTFVNHFSFHIMDPDWGHVVIKMCSHPPFGAQIILNGHEYVARQATKAGIAFSKEGNCFTSASSVTDLAKIAETLCFQSAVGRLTRVCDRWIYTACLYFALTPEEQEETRFAFRYSVYQMEYSRNLLFERGSELERTFQDLIDHTRSLLHVGTLRTVFGSKHRPYCRTNSTNQPRVEVALSRPRYDLTVFKLRFGHLTLKVYSKGARVLRVEAIVDNARTLDCPRSLTSFPDIANRLRGMVYRLLQVLRCVDSPSLDDRLWDELSKPAKLAKRRVAGVDLSHPRMRAVVEAVIALAPDPGGFTVTQLATKVREVACYSEDEYRPWSAAYDLLKLRAKHLVVRRAASHHYYPSARDLSALTALLVIIDKVIRPVLAGAGRPRPGRPRRLENPQDYHYRALQTEMWNLFQTLGITPLAA
jgi:hypothetical protein